MNDGHQGQLRAFFAKKRKQSLRQTLVDHARDDGVSQRLRKVASELSDHWRVGSGCRAPSLSQPARPYKAPASLSAARASRVRAPRAAERLWST